MKTKFSLYQLYELEMRCVCINLLGSRIMMDILLKLLLLLGVSLSSGLERKITAVRNPGCMVNYCNVTTVLHVRADGPNDTLHYLWDFTGKPSVLLAQTSLNASVKILWYEFIWNPNEISVTFSEEPTYTFGMVLDKVWEFNDRNDTGLLPDVEDGNIVSFSTGEFQWELVEFISQNNSNLLKMRSCNGTRNGTIEILVRSYGTKDHGTELPHLFHSSNSSQLDISIDNLETSPGFNSSRFALELVLLSQESKENKTFQILTRKSLDDEHTPGVFTLNDLISPEASKERKGGGWVLWRKVSYTSKIRDITNSTEVNEYKIEEVSDHSSALNDTIIYAFHGYKVDNYLVQSTKVSFGFKQDGFYKKSNYTTWTLLVGYGYPLEDEFSLLVILVISIGLGLPVLLIIIGSIYMALRGLSTNKDELLLSR